MSEFPRRTRTMNCTQGTDRPTSINYSFKVNGPWAAEILAGRKTVETSGQPCTKQGAAPGWVLLQGDTKRRKTTPTAEGAVKLGPRFKYETAAQFAADFEKHRVPAGDPYAFGKRATTYGFPVLDVIQFPNPVPVHHRNKLDQNRYKECEPVDVPPT